MKAVNEISYGKIICPNCHSEYDENSELYSHYYDIYTYNPEYPHENEFNAICENLDCKQKFRIVYETVVKFTSSIVTVSSNEKN